ncbi:hypothetical protein FRB94_012700 [Tulasnella sp. JGI-2019a]|nr:hypothetical protein FRB93_010601 [Tulasnella sp. JGI-2019a]KAG8991197.1 hypothetical protein FRB94_012700 [Tulasnella sp. JGI-2019a]
MATPKSINELPAEILGIVFFEFLEEAADQKIQIQRPERLSRVCRLWKELVEGNSRLWSRIDVALGDSYTPMKVQPIRDKLRKAKRSPLALYIHGGYWALQNAAIVTRNILTVYNLIKGHRWRALSIFNPGYLSSFEIIFCHMVDHPEMCRLSSLHIEEEGTTDPNDDVTGTLIKEVLRQNLIITHLAVTIDLLEPSHTSCQMVSYLCLTVSPVASCGIPNRDNTRSG